MIGYTILIKKITEDMSMKNEMCMLFMYEHISIGIGIFSEGIPPKYFS